MSQKKKRTRIRVQGTVQAVGFRPFIYRLATELDLAGKVKNLGDAGVEIVLEGSENLIQKFIKRLEEENPPLSKIEDIEVNYSDSKGLDSFQILESEKKDEGKAGTIPPDAAICDKCLSDMRNPDSRYYKYWATSCVDCGPRFTIIKSLPYDRPRTSMKEFPMCRECRKEYENPSDRRHHAQTIACPNCGPELFSHPESKNPVKKGTDLLINNRIIAIKGVGGTHLACNAYSKGALKKLKKQLHRPHQPLAVMAKNLEMIQEFAEIGNKEKEALTSIKRPIVLLDKLKKSPLSSEVSKGLHNVGVMLPYTGLHYLIFDNLDFPLVMTSANMPGRPMLVKNEKIISELDDIADYMILHDREIVARCDDSVIRFSNGRRKFLRRSRGWTPSPIKLEKKSDPVMALGAELDNTITLSDGKNCYISQHIGDVDNIETLNFLKETIDHISDITSIKIPEKIACDLHPEFLTTELAEKISKDPIKVQHHHAHMAGALEEKRIREAIGIAIDGVGYGPDGTVWGGEIMHATKSDYERVGHLSPMLMPGGDQATKYPARMIAGIFHKSDDLPKILQNHCKFPNGLKERKIVEKQIERRINTPKTTSAGRFLDAVSSLLDICQKRNYEGEPAMKLESFSIEGNPLDINTKIIEHNGKTVLDSQALMRDLIKLKESGKNPRDIGATAEECLARGLAKIAIEKTKDKGFKNIVLTGGVANNSHISNTIEKIVKSNNFNFVTNEKVPCGDGGTSFGQVVVASNQLSA